MSQIELQVRYQETDTQGVVYHANYFIWYDMARTEFLREHGCSYKELEAQGIFFVVAEAKNKYLRSLRFDDQVLIKTKLIQLGTASVEFEYDVINKAEDQIVSKGWTRLAVVDKTGKVIKIPQSVLDNLK